MGHPWERRKLGEIGKARSGVGFPDGEQGGTSGIPFYKVSDMNNVGNENEMVYANNYVSEDQIARHKWSPIIELPAIFFAKVGAAVMLNRKRLCRFPFLLDNNTMAYSLDNDWWKADFAKAFFETLDLTSLVQVGALPSYNAKDVEDIKLYLPGLAEQAKIGELFHHIDNLITLHQRKLDLLKEKKKGLLQKMFPKPGENKPELRFSGFTDPWKQRKISELFKITRGNVLAANKTEAFKSNEDPYPVYSSQTKNNGLMGYYKDYLYENAITWTTDGANAGTVNYRSGKFYCTNVCGVLLAKEIQPCLMVAERLNSVTKDYVSYVGNPKLMNNVMADININLPWQEEERQKMSDLFAMVDDLITLHQRKLDLLKEKKKGLLQKMFPKPGQQEPELRFSEFR